MNSHLEEITHLAFWLAFRCRGLIETGESDLGAANGRAEMTWTVEAAIVEGVGLGDSTSDARASQRIDDASVGKDSKVRQLLRSEAN